MGRQRLLAVAVLLVALTTTPATATVVVYTDRDKWTADVVPGVVIESFSSEASGDIETPYTTVLGTILDGSYSQIVKPSRINNTAGVRLHNLQSGAHVRFATPVKAFGFTYRTFNTGIVLEAGGTATTLPSDTKGFVGVITEVGTFSSFTLRGTMQGPLDLDDLSTSGLIFSGVPHTALGQATLKLDQGGRLVVSNLGDSGEDGVRIALGRSEGWDGYLLPVELADFGDRQEFRFIGSGQGVPPQVAMSVSAEKVGQVEKRLEIAIPSTKSVTIEAYRDGQLVYRETGHRLPETSLSKVPAGLVAVVVGLYILDHADAHVEYSKKDGWSGGVSWNHKATVQFDNGPQIETDRVKVLPERILFNTVEAVAILGKSIPSFTITDEAVRMFGLPHRPISGAALEAGGAKLAVTGLGSEGGGFSVQVGKVERFGMTFDPIDPSAVAPVGSYLKAWTIGLADSQKDQPMQSITVTRKSAAEFAIAARFSDGDTSAQRVQLYEGDRLVVDLPAGTVEAAVASKWPIGLGKLSAIGGIKYFSAAWPDITTFRIGGTLYSGDHLRIIADSASETDGSISDFTLQFKGISEVRIANAESEAVCVPGPTHLCLNGGRFRVAAAWRTVPGDQGEGQAVPLTTDTGLFWFFNQDNVELIVKVLDGCGLNRRFWVFAGGLTDVDVVLTVTDTKTGEVQTYQNPQGTAFQPIQDTSAFVACSNSGETRQVEGGAFTPAKPAVTSLLLNGGRFKVEVGWETFQGGRGVGQAVQLTDDTGYFWFFDDDNAELVVKALDGCSLNGRYWIFAGGLTDVGVTVQVTDTQTGSVRRYIRPTGVAFQPLLDTSAFASCR